MYTLLYVGYWLKKTVLPDVNYGNSLDKIQKYLCHISISKAQKYTLLYVGNWLKKIWFTVTFTSSLTKKQTTTHYYVIVK